jgi:hypothetical protein
MFNVDLCFGDATGSVAEEREELNKRLVCILYAAFMPKEGLEDALRHARDTFDWWAKKHTTVLTQGVEIIPATPLASREAAPFSIEEE